MKKYLLLMTFLFSMLSSFAKADDWYYLSSLGFLVKIDLETIIETGQLSAGTMPWGAASCDGHIYFSDFASDQIFDFSVEEKVLNKVKIGVDPSRVIEFYTYTKESEKQYKKPPMRRAFEIIRKPKRQAQKYDESQEALLIAEHNKKVGLGSIACNKDYVFVISTLKDRVEVLKRKNLERIASLAVGERPSHLAINQEQNLLAISSTAFDKVYLADLKKDFAKTNEIEVGDGPTEMAWFNDKLFVLNRGGNTISVISPSSKEAIKTINFETSINALAVDNKNNILYVLDGTEKKLYLVNANTYTIQKKEITEPLKFPSILSIINDNEILIGSENDGRFLILNNKSFEAVRKIQTNLPPHILVKLNKSNNSSK